MLCGTWIFSASFQHFLCSVSLRTQNQNSQSYTSRSLKYCVLFFRGVWELNLMLKVAQLIWGQYPNMTLSPAQDQSVTRPYKPSTVHQLCTIHNLYSRKSDAFRLRASSAIDFCLSANFMNHSLFFGPTYTKIHMWNSTRPAHATYLSFTFTDRVQLWWKCLRGHKQLLVIKVS